MNTVKVLEVFICVFKHTHHIFIIPSFNGFLYNRQLYAQIQCSFKHTSVNWYLYWQITNGSSLWLINEWLIHLETKKLQISTDLFILGRGPGPLLWWFGPVDRHHIQLVTTRCLYHKLSCLEDPFVHCFLSAISNLKMHILLTTTHWTDTSCDIHTYACGTETVFDAKCLEKVTLL